MDIFTHEANHSKAKVPIGNQIVTVERGQRLTSILTLFYLLRLRFKSRKTSPSPPELMYMKSARTSTGPL